MGQSLALEARNRLGVTIRHHGSDPQRVSAARRDLAAAKLEEYIKRTVESAPPLTAAQRDRTPRCFSAETLREPARTAKRAERLSPALDQTLSQATRPLSHSLPLGVGSTGVVSHTGVRQRVSLTACWGFRVAQTSR